ncbi:aspartate aminotransferase family protein [Nonomuraea sp. FMUSA5-5]|uniref:Aspartate aminotransferase family protein n=1 Tax=Nonomuraea composti TaxID=2720023 RepID=A0ABX1BGG1_9ACTN|nr:aspartate aminotransferase family protein [Nonomuraea sp. FMUSA5-5]NJP95427.1 aspartate aminotransferase family protein [Nonomuraea sp. FMUSA5-5]
MDRLSTTKAILANAADHVWRPWAPIHADHDPLLLVEGQGCEVVAADGRRFLDARAGVFNAALGYGRQDVATVMATQAVTLMAYTLQEAITPPAAELATRLARLFGEPLSRTFFCNSGSEAIESAIKVARMFHALSGAGHRRLIVSLAPGYHGSTLATAAMTGMPAVRALMEPLPEGFVLVPGDQAGSDPSAVAACALGAGADQVAAVVVEPVLGVAGIRPLPLGYLAAVRRLCDGIGALMVVDEVMTGYGRTGRWFGYQHEPLVLPDIVVTSKGLTAGYAPLATMTCRQHIYEVFARDPVLGGLRHGFTTGGHATACAAACAVLDAIETEGLVENAARVGVRLLSGLRTLIGEQGVRQVRGRGLLAAVEFDTADRAAEVALRLRETHRVLARLQGAVVAFAPPLICTEVLADRICEAMACSLRPQAVAR